MNLHVNNPFPSSGIDSTEIQVRNGNITVMGRARILSNTFEQKVSSFKIELNFFKSSIIIHELFIFQFLQTGEIHLYSAGKENKLYKQLFDWAQDLFDKLKNVDTQALADTLSDIEEYECKAESARRRCEKLLSGTGLLLG